PKSPRNRRITSLKMTARASVSAPSRSRRATISPNRRNSLPLTSRMTVAMGRPVATQHRDIGQPAQMFVSTGKPVKIAKYSMSTRFRAGNALETAARSLRADGSTLARRRPTIDPGISACGRDRQPPQVMRPTPVVVGDLGRVRKTAVGHAQQRAAVPLDKIDLDQARSRRHLVAFLPTQASGDGG